MKKQFGFYVAPVVLLDDLTHEEVFDSIMIESYDMMPDDRQSILYDIKVKKSWKKGIEAKLIVDMKEIISENFITNFKEKKAMNWIFYEKGNETMVTDCAYPHSKRLKLIEGKKYHLILKDGRKKENKILEYNSGRAKFI